jgi:hypothetical protein
MITDGSGMTFNRYSGFVFSISSIVSRCICDANVCSSISPSARRPRIIGIKLRRGYGALSKYSVYLLQADDLGEARNIRWRVFFRASLTTKKKERTAR